MKKITHHTLLGSASALALLSAFNVSGALAQSVTIDGALVAGSPNVANQVTVGDQQTLAITTGASINTAADAVVDAAAGNMITVDNQGAITSTGNSAISAFGSTLTLTNSGTITGDSFSINVSTLANSTNSGAITSTIFSAITSSDITSLNNSGNITGNTNGIFAGGTLTNLINSGMIVGNNSDGINANATTSITNSGTIMGGIDGVDASSVTTFTNSGTITGQTGGGVLISQITTFTNSGAINAQSDGGIVASNITTFTNSGTINSQGNDGVFAFTISDLTNSGTISASSNAIDSTTIMNLTNSGNITSNDNTINALNITGTLTNTATGIISATGGPASAIRLGANLNNLNNAGMIISQDNNAIDTATITNLTNSGTIMGDDDGVETNNITGTFNNSGTIIGITQNGISTGDLNMLINSGTIMGGSGPNDNGINTNFGTIMNSGTISGDTGIEVDRSSAGMAIITNSGTITGSGGTAIDLQQNATDTITLAGNSVIDGIIDIQDMSIGGNQDTLILDNSLMTDSAITFDSAATVTNLAITENRHNVIRQGNQVIFANTNGDGGAAGSTSLFLADISSVLLNSLDNNAGNGSHETVSTHGSINNSGDGQDLRQVWLSGFGGISEFDGDNNLTALDHSYGGGMAGVETVGADGTTTGFLAGGFSSNIDHAGANTSSLETDGGFVGLYRNANEGDSFTNLALIVGFANFENNRQVGVNTAVGEFDGWFVTPSITFGKPVETGLGDNPLTASLRLNYTGLFADGYTETGVGVPLTVGSRDVHQFGARAQLALPTIKLNEDGSHTHIEWRTGAEGQFNIGDNELSGTLAGTAINLSADTGDNVSGFFGGTFTHTSADGMSLLSASAEVQSNFNDTYELTGQIRLTRRF